MVRRSIRPPAPNAPGPAEHSSFSGDETDVNEPPRKKQRSTTTAKRRTAMKTRPNVKRLRGSRGALQLLTEMPIDVLFEIFTHLNLGDLLHLTRTSKAFRYILCGKSSRGVWKQAQENEDGLPECPEDMSGLAYASLAFDTRCHGCPSRISQKCWEIRGRWCLICLMNDTRFIPYPSHGFDYSRSFLSLLPKVDVVTISKSMYKGPLRHEITIYYQPIVEKYYKEYSGLENTAKKEWVKAARSKRGILREHAKACNEWHEIRANVQSALQLTATLDDS